ncbi:hypothetical protein [Altererythrobacter sp. Root672]|uniref:hypothetical protein n=1 Tax=Altererythrobacter sp. Root672 TaxID=1736584 RepID=UPI0006F5EDF4|nr:hypothetical protein [Altererythrobacter sp. Root672]KRA84378.1 hypothetical protein ASD76_10475 [Altererythrobacter sp. Root672]
MDLNQLYYDHQVLLMQACGAGPGDARLSHETGARRIANRIGSIQRHSGAVAAIGWESLAALPGAALCSSLTAKAFDPQLNKIANGIGAS